MSQTKGRGLSPADFWIDQKAIQAAIDATLKSGLDGKISAESATIIHDAETSDMTEWQVRYSKGEIGARMAAVKACQEFTNSRASRLQSFADAKNHDYVEAMSNWILDRQPMYYNYINRRGPLDGRRALPVNRNTASSDLDWEAAIEAKLMFAAFPNLNPKDPVPNAKHTPA